MIKPKQTAYLAKRALPSYVLIILAFIALIFLLPANKGTMNVYGFSSLEYKIVLFSVSLPSILVWLAAFVGYAKLKEYAEFVKRTPEGEHFDKLAKGVFWLAWSLPISRITTVILQAIANDWTAFKPAATIIGNYISLVLILVAFTYIATASSGLATYAKLKLSAGSSKSIMFLFVTAGVSYCYFTFRLFDLDSLTSTSNPYYLPIWLIVTTLIIPYLYSWFIGFLAAYEITLFSRNVQGHLYRRALVFLAVGLITVIGGSIALQYLNSIQPSKGYLLIDYKLALSLLFRIVQGIGFSLLAVGAIRLKKIEEV